MSAISLPGLKLDHLLRLTDCTGIIQHATYSLPDRRTGYTTDDNARALIVALRLYDQLGDPRALRLAEGYLSFLAYAQTEGGTFRNFMDYDRRFLEEEGSQDAMGRAVWAAGLAVAEAPTASFGLYARRILERALPSLPGLDAPRARAHAILGLCRYLEAQPDNRQAQGALRVLATSLVDLFRLQAVPGWRWFEGILTYSNAVLPMALLEAHAATGSKAYLKSALESLGFLTDAVIEQGVVRLVGNAGWYPRGGRKAAFDEQPEDAGLLVLACLAAQRATGRQEFSDLATAVFGWFLGQNALGQPLYDGDTGGCYDGLTPGGVNLNQGAESLLAYLLSYLAILESRQGSEAGVAGSGA